MPRPLLRLLDRKGHRVLAALLMAVLFAGGFAGTSLFNQHRFTFIPAAHVHLHLDSWIPFSASWVWVYVLYYPFCFLPLWLQEIRRDPDLFLRTGIGFSLQFGFSYLCFVAIPLQMVHPQLAVGASSFLLSKLYSMDHGFNSFPSLHVANVTFVVFLFARLRGARFALPLAAVALLIALSTVLVKQHYVADVLLGACLGWVTFYFSFRVVPKSAGLLDDLAISR